MHESSPENKFQYYENTVFGSGICTLGICTWNLQNFGLGPTSKNKLKYLEHETNDMITRGVRIMCFQEVSMPTGYRMLRRILPGYFVLKDTMTMWGNEPHCTIIAYNTNLTDDYNVTHEILSDPVLVRNMGLLKLEPKKGKSQDGELSNKKSILCCNLHLKANTDGRKSNEILRSKQLIYLHKCLKKYVDTQYVDTHEIVVCGDFNIGKSTNILQPIKSLGLSDSVARSHKGNDLSQTHVQNLTYEEWDEINGWTNVVEERIEGDNSVFYEIPSMKPLDSSCENCINYTVSTENKRSKLLSYYDHIFVSCKQEDVRAEIKDTTNIKDATLTDYAKEDLIDHRRIECFLRV